MRGLFKTVNMDKEFTHEYRKIIWNKEKSYRDYAFVIYDTDNIYIDSIDPIEQIFQINNRIFIRNDMYIYEAKVSSLQNLTCRVEECHYNYQNENMNYIDINISSLMID